jgi:hypothetical protein
MCETKIVKKPEPDVLHKSKAQLWKLEKNPKFFPTVLSKKSQNNNMSQKKHRAVGYK